jgi:hypothetical protein
MEIEKRKKMMMMVTGKECGEREREREKERCVWNEVCE